MSQIVIGDIALRWIVTVLFGVSIATATYVGIVVAQRGRWALIINHLLHPAMSAAMILMLWHGGMQLPTVGPIVFFLVAAVWFMPVAGRVSAGTSNRLTNYYSAAMVAAMAWMYMVLSGIMPGHTGHALSGPWVGMSEMDASLQDMSPTAPGPAWMAMVNWIATLGFAVVAMYWPCRYLAERRAKSRRPAAPLTHVQMLGEAFTAAGTALMFAIML